MQKLQTDTFVFYKDIFINYLAIFVIPWKKFKKQYVENMINIFKNP